jgi:hypothetical protein
MSRRSTSGGYDGRDEPCVAVSIAWANRRAAEDLPPLTISGRQPGREVGHLFSDYAHVPAVTLVVRDALHFFADLRAAPSPSGGAYATRAPLSAITRLAALSHDRSGSAESYWIPWYLRNARTSFISI